jgi:4-hydroxy-tetrahydrodipicolinate synthase
MDMLKGSFVALVTPFRDGKIDERGVEDLIEFHIRSGTDGFVPCGTTGEAATLTHEEHEYLMKLVIDIVDGRRPVIPGAGSNCTEEAIRLTRFAKKSGADGVLLITPYYNKPTPAGLIEHFSKIASAVDIPIVMYNVPGRTGVNMLPQTVFELSKIDNIVGIKEASGNISQVADIINRCGDNIAVLTGEDAILLPVLSIGGKGAISATSNVIPREMHELCQKFEAGNIKEAQRIANRIFPICKAMFIETNPIPVKTTLSLMGMISNELRLPLVGMKEENLNYLKKIIKDFGLID